MYQIWMLTAAAAAWICVGLNLVVATFPIS